MLLIHFTLLMTLKSNLLFTTESTIISLYALLTGNLLPIICIPFYPSAKFSDFCNTSLTNLHSDCFLPFAQKFNVQANKNPTDAPFWFLCGVLVYTIDHLISVPPLNLKTICSLEYIVIVSITAFQSPVSKSVIKRSCFSNSSRNAAIIFFLEFLFAISVSVLSSLSFVFAYLSASCSYFSA